MPGPSGPVASTTLPRRPHAPPNPYHGCSLTGASSSQQAVRRLGDRQAFTVEGEEVLDRDDAQARVEALLGPGLAGLRRDLEQRVRSWSLAAGIIVAALMLAAFGTAYTQRADVPAEIAAGGTAVGTVAGFLVGRAIGRMVAYGSLGSLLARRGIRFSARAGDIDRAAGLKPLGDYYFSQALLLAIPAVFLLIWSLLFLLPQWQRYEVWRPRYLALLLLAIVIEIAAFFAPMWTVHRDMKREKARQLHAADRLSDEIARLRHLLDGELSRDRREDVQQRMNHLVGRYREIETMSTWPIDPRIRRRLTLGNAALVLTLVTQVATLAGFD